MYEGSEVKIWGIYKTSRSANWKTAERFVRKYGDVMEEFCEDGVVLEGFEEIEEQEDSDEEDEYESEYDTHDYDKPVEDDGRHQYVVRVSEQGLLKIKAITEEAIGKVYVKMKKLDD